MVVLMSPSLLGDCASFLSCHRLSEREMSLCWRHIHSAELPKGLCRRGGEREGGLYDTVEITGLAGWLVTPHGIDFPLRKELTVDSDIMMKRPRENACLLMSRQSVNQIQGCDRRKTEAYVLSLPLRPTKRAFDNLVCSRCFGTTTLIVLHQLSSETLWVDDTGLGKAELKYYKVISKLSVCPNSF